MQARKFHMNRKKSTRRSLMNTISREGSYSELLVKPKNPPVPRFPHPDNLNNSSGASLIEQPTRKPRPPRVPDHLRASNPLETPAERILRESMEHSSMASKKPRVPKVAELMPTAKLIKPPKPSDNTDANESLKSLSIPTKPKN